LHALTAHHDIISCDMAPVCRPLLLVWTLWGRALPRHLLLVPGLLLVWLLLVWLLLLAWVPRWQVCLLLVLLAR
jgi:hypothetical protein